MDRNWSGSSDVTLRRPRFPTHFPANALIESRRRLRSTVSSVIVEPQRFPSDFLSFLPSFFFKERSLPGSRVSSALPFLPVRTKKNGFLPGFTEFFFQILTEFFFYLYQVYGFRRRCHFFPNPTVEGVSGFFLLGFYRVLPSFFKNIYRVVFFYLYRVYGFRRRCHFFYRPEQRRAFRGSIFTGFLPGFTEFFF